jgi:glycosidase
MIAIYSDWITRYRIDGYRIDTAKHVDPAFGALHSIRAVAKAHGIPISRFSAKSPGTRAMPPTRRASPGSPPFPRRSISGFAVR